MLQIRHFKKHIWTITTIGSVCAIGIALWLWHPAGEKQPSSTPQSSIPKPAPTLSYVDQTLAKMSLHDKVASLFIFHTPTSNPASLATYLATYKPAGLIFMDDNIPPTTAQLITETQSLTTDKLLPPLLAVDEEGDTVKRLASDTFPGALTLPSLPPSATATAFLQRSSLLRSVGLNLNFGIIADVTDNPNSFIFPRVLGTTPNQAADRVAQAVIGSKGKTLTTLKHFPGHGETTADSHTTIPSTDVSFADWQQRDAVPFKAGIDAGADVVMFGHLVYSAVDTTPATLSSKWHDIIRNNLGFKGLIVTDDMIMLQDSGDPRYVDPVKNAITAINAGNDLLLYVVDHGSATTKIDPNSLVNGVVAAVNSGQINQSTIDAHARAILAERYKIGQLFSK